MRKELIELFEKYGFSVLSEPGQEYEDENGDLQELGWHFKKDGKDFFWLEDCLEFSETMNRG